MTKIFGPFDSGQGSQMYVDQWRKMMSSIVPDGTVETRLDGLMPYADSSGMVVKVMAGAGWIQGFFYQNTDEEVIAVTAAHATLPRWDYLVLQVDWTKTDNQITTVVIAGTPAASPALPTLTQTNSVWQIPLAKIAVAAAATLIAAADVTDMRSVISQGSSGTEITVTNYSAITLTDGMVVVMDSTHDNGVTTTTKVGDPSVYGVVKGTISVGGVGKIVQGGNRAVAITGAVTRGHELVTSATPGYAQDSGRTQKSTAHIGFATTGYAGSGTSTVSAALNVVPSTSTNLLQFLSTITVTGSGASFGHDVDTGSDFLMVLALGKTSVANQAPSAASWKGSGMTGLASLYDTTSGLNTAAIFYRPAPALGSGIATITQSNINVLYGVALNLCGSQSSPIRTYYSGLILANTVPVVAGDIVVDIAINGSTLTPANGQTLLYSTASAPYVYFSYYKATTSGNMTLGWTGTGSSLVHITAVIAGS